MVLDLTRVIGGYIGDNGQEHGNYYNGIIMDYLGFGVLGLRV